jgi:hypothetical protein
MNLNNENLDVFITDIEYYTQIEKQIIEVKNLLKPLREKLKKLTNEKKEIELQLSNTMKKNELFEIELPDKKGIIEYKAKNSLVPIKQDDIKIKMIDFFENGKGSELSFNSLNPEQKGTELYNFIYAKENRDKILKETLKSKNLTY